MQAVRNATTTASHEERELGGWAPGSSSMAPFHGMPKTTRALDARLARERTRRSHLCRASETDQHGEPVRDGVLALASHGYASSWAASGAFCFASRPPRPIFCIGYPWEPRVMRLIPAPRAARRPRVKAPRRVRHGDGEPGIAVGTAELLHSCYTRSEAAHKWSRACAKAHCPRRS